mmetsp:Transcript_30085/g.66207  ORF Transcript_30085/g.66207 Transcript_30085/m.66207 type:complete len:352 (+) Transcript_30085:1071-2126(+)
MDAELQALAKLLIELLVVVLLLGDLCEHLKALLHQVLLDHTQDLVLLQGLTRDVEWEILRIHNTLDHVEPLRHQFLAIIHDEHATDVQLDVVPLLLRLEEVKRGTTWHEEERAELQLAFDAEVLHCQVIFPIIRQALVEGGILLVCHVLALAHPQWLVLVELLPLVRDLLYLLGLLLLFFFLFLLIDFLDLWLITFLALLVLLLFLLFLGISDLLLLGLLYVELNGETNEFGVLLHQVLQSSLLQELGLVLLEVADDLGTSLDLSVDKLGVLLHCEGATCCGFPDVLLVVIVLANNSHLVRHKVGRVEADAELPNHGDVASSGHRLHESLGTRLGDSAQVVDQLILGHAYA